MRNSYLQIIKQLDRFAKAFSGISTLEGMWPCLDLVFEGTFNAENVGLYLYDHSEVRLKLLYSKGLNKNEVANLEVTAMDRNPGLVLQSGNMINIPDILFDDDKALENSKMRSFVVRSLLCIPIMNCNQIVGAFEIVDAKPTAFNEEDIAILSFICSLIGALYDKILNQTELKKLALIAKETENAVIISNKTGEIEWVNDAFTRITEYSLDEIKGKIPDQFLQGEETDPNTVALLAEAIKKQKSIEVDLINYSKSKNKYWVKIQIQPVFDSAGRLKNFISIQKKITKEKEIEQKLIKSEAKHARMVENISDVIVIIDKDGNNSYKSPNIEKLFGWRPDELIGVSTLENLHPEDRVTAQEFLNSIREQNASGVFECRYRCKDQNYRWIEFTAMNLMHDRDILGILGNYHDITERKQAEALLKKSESKFNNIFNNSPALMLLLTASDRKISAVNDTFLQKTGLSRDEIIGKVITDIELLSFSDKQPKIAMELQKTQRIVGLELELKSVRGEIIHCELSRELIETYGNQYFLVLITDITERKEQYDALQIANLRFKSLISSMQAGVMVENELRKVVLVNQYFCDLFSINLPPEQLVGMKCSDAAESSKALFTDPETFIKDIDNTLRLRHIVTNHELQLNNGRSLERDFIPIEDYENKNQGILWIYRNITERKKAEKDLHRQSEILSGTALAMNYLLTIQDHDHAMQKALEAVGIATGVDRAYIFESYIDKITDETFLSQRFEWTAEGVMPQIDNPDLQNMPFSKDFPRWYNLLSNNRTLSGFVKDFPDNERQLLEPQDIISLIVVPVFVNDQFWGTVGFDDCSKGIKWSANEASILTALAASIGGSISREIIGKELTNAREIAENATKTKSDFLATMSHEIRTPMNGVIGMTSLLLQTPLTPDQRDYTETIKISGELLLNLINDILDFSKIESGKMVLEEHDFDLRMAIEDVIDLLATGALQKKLGLYFQIDPEIAPIIKGDLTRLRQILVNLAGNAIKFTSNGEVVISVKQIEKNEHVAILEFSVKDTGMGIPAKKIDSLFKPFSQIDASTTRKYGGTGLGLAICSKLVKLMNGVISVKSEINHGSEFLFTIKTYYPDIEAKSQKLSSNLSILEGKKLLIIDANPTSNTILLNICISLGMNVLSSYSANNAINIINDKKVFDLILIENGSLEMDCNLLASEIKKSNGHAEIPLIVITNPSTKTDKILNAYDNFNIRINKPLKQSQLISNMIDLLSGIKDPKIQSINRPIQFLKINEIYPLNILVAEDNTINQKLILRLFEMLGYTIHIAANGYEVIDALNRMEIDIVFMDIQMPEMDGLEATQQIIAQWSDKRPLIVAMTANALKSDREKCLAAGMDDYISKPLTINQVRAGIEKWAPMCNI